MNTLIIGASINPDRYSNKALRYLKSCNLNVYAIGVKPGYFENNPIYSGYPKLENIHTVLLYIGPQKQKDYYDYILSLNPVRIIFNPGTFNQELIDLVKAKNIEAIIGCAINMIANKSYFI